jgi:hypothetical protein
MTRHVGRRRTASGLVLFVLFGMVGRGQIATLEQRATGAERVVVATVRQTAPEWRENEFGDRLIVSRIQLQVDEALKGGADSTMWLEMEGGTLDGFTLRVSSLPMLEPGNRAVFFLDAADRGVYRPHLRGQGILFLDDHNIVRGSSLPLTEIRTVVRGLGK